jgi:hypothetical protein
LYGAAKKGKKFVKNDGLSFGLPFLGLFGFGWDNEELIN